MFFFQKILQSTRDFFDHCWFCANNGPSALALALGCRNFGHLHREQRKHQQQRTRYCACSNTRNQSSEIGLPQSSAHLTIGRCDAPCNNWRRSIRADKFASFFKCIAKLEITVLEGKDQASNLALLNPPLISSACLMASISDAIMPLCKNVKHNSQCVTRIKNIKE